MSRFRGLKTTRSGGQSEVLEALEGEPDDPAERFALEKRDAGERGARRHFPGSREDPNTHLACG